MYQWIRPFLFRFSPEKAHHMTLAQLERADRLGVLSCMVPKLADKPKKVMGLTFKNPVGLAAGLDKNGQYIDALFKLGFGFVEVGTVTPLAQPGNPSPRMFRLVADEALINRLGFNNDGLEVFLHHVRQSKHIQQKGSSRGVLGLNIGKNAKTPLDQAHSDYQVCLQGVYPYADYVTVNISSPNTQQLRALQEGSLRRLLFQTLQQEREKLSQQHQRHVPILIKIAPDLEKEGIFSLVDEVIEFGFEGIIATNTTTSRLLVQHDPQHQETGGLSGRPLFEKSTEVLRWVRGRAGDRLALIGVGGVTQPEQIQQKLDAGADLVQLYTGLIYQGPRLLWDGIGALK
jgi:dihydroorotate dehydrogenase